MTIVSFDVSHLQPQPCDACLMAAIGAQEADGSGWDDTELLNYCKSQGHAQPIFTVQTETRRCPEEGTGESMKENSGKA